MKSLLLLNKIGDSLALDNEVSLFLLLVQLLLFEEQGLQLRKLNTVEFALLLLIQSRIIFGLESIRITVVDLKRLIQAI